MSTLLYLANVNTAKKKKYGGNILLIGPINPYCIN